MAELIENCKKWISLVQKMDLDRINLMDITSIKHDNESDKYLFKLLLYLSHCADRCYKEKLSKENQIFSIANAICKSLTKILDKKKFFSALYFVLSYILSKKLYKEAKIICGYLFPGKFVNSKDTYKSSEYYQVATLWQSEILKTLDIIINSKTKKEVIDEEFCTVVNFNLQILEFCDESLSYTFKITETYIKKLSNLSLDTAFPCLLQLFKYLLNYVTNLKKMPITKSYNLIISMVGYAFYKRNDALNNSNILNYFCQCDSYFLKSLIISPVCYNCYKFFRDYTMNLFETNFMSSNVGKLRLQKSFETLNLLIQKYGIRNSSVCETIAAIAYSFDIIYPNWEIVVSKQLNNTNITYDDILNMGNFMKQVHNILKNRPFPPNYTCKMCLESNKCPVTQGIYNASLATISYIRVIVKFSSDVLSEKIFLNTKYLLEEVLLVFEELEKSGCKYASLMWDLCGRIIFNIGLISESKYPSHLEELYKVLCTQVVHRDGLNSKLSSFGLENPVSVTLHRLCNINFYQEKYREAMSFVAYNALISNHESRKKKAFDMWANIKVKVLDSHEIQNLTLLKCLKMDSGVVEKLGINVDLENYDLNYLCLRELKSLYQAKHNMMLSMEKTLNELESSKNNIYYTQGLLFLCLHALQFSKRKYISDYLSAAIDKISKHKLKTISNQCLLANLKFFRVIEKLFVRSQAINKQIDDANFTVKRFKILRDNRLCDETEAEDNIVPTYGEISIKEDNRCAKDLQEVVTLWETCIQGNMMEVVNSWEPKIMLELIVICAEYCRLYKFDSIEEKVWTVGYKLALALQDFTTCIYITSRSISLRYINDTWISDAEGYVENIKNSSKTSESDVVALFWLSLVDYYFDCKKIKEAKSLLKKVKVMPNYDLLTNSKIYIYSIDIEMRNYYTINTMPNQEDYCKLLVEIHYLMINLHDTLAQDFCRFSNIRFQLFSCEQMFETMYNMAIPMISLLSFREISAHLSDGLKFAQKLGLTLRIAQCLKFFCYIDLLRMQVESCEVKLQDLEHILCLENFPGSMKAKFQDEKNQQIVSPTNAPVDFSENCASPELKKKMFSSPGFLVHTPYCQCFTCTNLNYQYLSFSCAHIRAQLYSILNYTREAEQYYHGAYKIKLRIDERESTLRQCKTYKWKCSHNFTIDTLLYLLNFSMFIVDFKPNQKEAALDLIEYALEIASKNDLDKHCVAVYANELHCQLYMYDAFRDKLDISVPTTIPITITNHTMDGCLTPKQKIENTSINLRRRKSPRPIAIPTINIMDNSDTENNRVVASKNSKRKTEIR